MRYARIPDQAVQRLPLYLRALLTLQERAVTYISSGDLARATGVNDWQVRKDLSYFGQFGTPGVGYSVTTLVRDIRKALRLDKPMQAVLVGVGNLGRAILAYGGFQRYGLRISAAFDKDPAKIGQVIGSVKVQDISSLGKIKDRGIYLAIVAVPAYSAQEVVDYLVKAGIKGIMSFAACPLNAPKKVKVISIDIASHLATLPYYLSSG